MRLLSTAAALLVATTGHLLAIGHCHAEEAFVSLGIVPPRFILETGSPSEDAIAWGSFKNHINKTGFAYLEIQTNGTYPDSYQAYAAGLVEGYLTGTLISMHYNNTIRDYCKGQEEYCKRLNNFMQTNLDYVNQKAKELREKDAYWHQTELALTQLLGVQDAWTGQSDNKYFPSEAGYTKITPILFMNADGDIEDLEHALGTPNPRRVLGAGHCSGLVRLAQNQSDLFVAQVTWSTYSSMLRILKKYKFNYHQTFLGLDPIPGHTMSFSSSPGRILSGDDFHVISTGLTSIETTIGNSNPDLWSKITPKCNLEWLRTIVANRLAVTGDQWAKLFQREHSGSYNNQWLIVDYNKFTPGKPLQPGALTVLEEIPGMIKFADQTAGLNKQSYWPSYNVPFYKEIYNESGWVKLAEKFGDWFTYEKSPRANIFRRDQSRVNDLDAMIKLMRYNDYQHDEFSRCNCTPPYSAENAISARCDLNPANGTYPFAALGHRSHGATDAKVTNLRLAQKLRFVAVAGPTYNPLPPFRWSTSGLPDRHEGQPDLWTFRPHIHKWRK